MRSIKTKDKARRMKNCEKDYTVGRRMKSSYLRARAAASRTTDRSEGSPEEYGSDRLQSTFEELGRETPRSAVRGMKRITHRIRRSVQKRRQVRDGASLGAEAAPLEPAYRPETAAAYPTYHPEHHAAGSQEINRSIRQAARPESTRTAGQPVKDIRSAGKSVKAAGHSEKVAAKTSKAAGTAAVQSQASARMKQAAARTAEKTEKAAARTAKAIAKAIEETAEAAVNGVKALITLAAGGGTVGVIIIVIVCLVGFLLVTPFGIFFSGENRQKDAVPVSAAMAQVYFDFGQELSAMQKGGYDDIVFTGKAADPEEVLAVFAVRVAGDDGNPTDVVTLDAERIARLKEVFRDMNTLSSETDTVFHEDSDPYDDIDDSWEECTLYLSLDAKTAGEMQSEYGFSASQRQVLDELLEQRQMLSDLLGEIQSLTADADVVIRNLPDYLPEDRAAVVKAACSLVGKVNYFWGGKSQALGWDSQWGAVRQVWAAGSPSTGTFRPFGLDCSGFVDWVFFNASGGTYLIGHGGGAAFQHSECRPVSISDAMPGDLVFMGDDDHVGVIAGWDDEGKLLVIHCDSGYDNVVVTGAEGFAMAGRPYWYG